MNVKQWHQCLLDHFFLPDNFNEKQKPVTRLCISKEILGFASNLPTQDAVNDFKGLFVSKILEDRFATLNADELLPPLVLSLLAATMDEETVGEGNFRKRLQELLGFKPIERALELLPQLWQLLDAFLRNHLDYRPLQLPTDIGRETRIGHSKRLAFPAYKDYEKLTDVIKGIDANVQDEKFVKEVKKRVKRSLTSNNYHFAFIEEFNLFDRTSSLEEAVCLPFWQAVEGIVWDTLPDKHVRWGRYQITVKDEDQGFLFQIEQRRRLFPRILKPFSPLQDILSYLRKHLDHIETFREQIDSGCLGFMQDEDGVWRSCHKLPHRGEVILVGRCNVLCDLKIAVWEPISKKEDGDAELWGCSDRLDLQELYEDYDGCPPLSILESPPKERILIEGIRYTPPGGRNGYLFRPSYKPVVRNRLPVKCCLPRNSSTSLIERNDGQYFPDHCPPPEAETITLHLDGIDGEPSFVKEINVYRRLPWPLTLKQAQNEKEWLEVGRLGQLGEDGLVPNRWAASVRHPVEMGVGAEGPHRSFSTMEGFDVLPQKASDLIEILAARFARRRGLSAQDIIEMIDTIYKTGVPSAKWNILRLLEESGTIQYRHRRNYGVGIYFPVPPALHTVRSSDGTLHSRFDGLFPEELRQEIQSICDKINLKLRTFRFDEELSFHLPLIESLDECTLEQVSSSLSSELGIDCRESPTLKWRSVLPDVLAQTWEPSLEQQGERNYWDPARRAFVAEKPSRAEIRLTRYRSRSRDRQDEYVLDNKEDRWCTRSREWALWVYYACSQTPACRAAGNRCYRVCVDGVYFPLPVVKYGNAHGAYSVYSEKRGYRYLNMTLPFPLEDEERPTNILRWRQGQNRARHLPVLWRNGGNEH